MNRINMWFKRLANSKGMRNSFWIIGEQVFQMFVSLIVGMLSARYLGPGNYGSLNYTASLVSFFSAISTLGMEGVVVKKLIEHPNEEGDYLGACILLRFFASVFSILSIGIMIVILNPGNPLKLCLGLIQGIQLAWKSVFILDSWFQRHLCSRYVSLGKAGACLCVATYKIYLLVAKKSIIWFAFSTVISEMILALTVFWFYSQETTQKIRINLKKGMEVLKESYHFIISGLMSATYGQMDKIMIGSYLGDQQVGYYTTANTISSMWLFVPIAVINSFQPKILELKNSKNEKLYQRRLEQLYSFLIWMCIGFSLVVCVFSRWIVQILYGDAYTEATETLKICIWYELFAIIGTMRGIWILAEKKNQYAKYFLGIGAVVNIILNVIWIPTYGINGAAYATLITQIVTSMISPLLFKETRSYTKFVLESFVCKWWLDGRKIEG